MLLRFAFRTNAHVPHSELSSVTAAPNYCDMTTHAKGLALRPGPQEAFTTHGALSVPIPCGLPRAAGARFSFPPPQGSAGTPGLPRALPLSWSKVLTPLGPQAVWDFLAVSEHPCLPGHGARDTDKSAVCRLPVHLPHLTGSSLMMGTTFYTFSTLNAFYRASP